MMPTATIATPATSRAMLRRGGHDGDQQDEDGGGAAGDRVDEREVVAPVRRGQEREVGQLGGRRCADVGEGRPLDPPGERRDRRERRGAEQDRRCAGPLRIPGPGDEDVPACVQGRCGECEREGVAGTGAPYPADHRGHLGETPVPDANVSRPHGGSCPRHREHGAHVPANAAARQPPRRELDGEGPQAGEAAGSTPTPPRRASGGRTAEARPSSRTGGRRARSSPTSTRAACAGGTRS